MLKKTAPDADIRRTIMEVFAANPTTRNIRDKDDFFECGISSLTIIEMQLSVEKVLGFVVPTSNLMGLSTIDEWVALYSASAATRKATLAGR